jgi:hypothetical protein
VAHAGQLGGFTLSNTTATLSNDNPDHLLKLTANSDLGIMGLSVPVDGTTDAKGELRPEG